MANKPVDLPFSGVALREARERAGLTLVMLAQRAATNGCPVSYTQISKLERGLHKPSPRVLRALVEALQVTVDDLLSPERAA